MKKVRRENRLTFNLEVYVAVGEIFAKRQISLFRYFKINGYPDGIIFKSINRLTTSTFKD